MNKPIVSDTQSLDQLIAWLHRDIDHSLDGVGVDDEVRENYSKMFYVLNSYRESIRPPNGAAI